MYESSGEVEGNGGFPLASGSVVFVAANIGPSVKATAGGLNFRKVCVFVYGGSALVPRECV